MKYKNIVIAGLPEAYRAIKEMNPETLPVRCYLALSISLKSMPQGTARKVILVCFVLGISTKKECYAVPWTF